MMRNLVLLALSGTLFMLFCASAGAEVLYVRPDNGASAVQYRWHDAVIRDPISVTAAIAIAKKANGTRPIEIRLLRQQSAEETFYSVDLSSYRSALRWNGSDDNKLVVRGQGDRAGLFPAATPIMVGKPLGRPPASLEASNFVIPRPAALLCPTANGIRN